MGSKTGTFYEYIGDDENSLGYVKGREYALVVSDRPFSQRILGIPLGLPFSWKIIVLEPIACAYHNESCFKSSWKLKFTRHSDGQ